MLAVPVFDMQGKRAGKMEIDPDVLGGRVRPRLLKQAIVTHLDRRRQDSARTKRRSDVEGSTRKLYRQKGTGNARAGAIRTPVRRGGGRTFGRRGPRAVMQLPKKMRRLARNSAILSKIVSEDAMIVEALDLPEIKTKTMAVMFAALGAEKGCVVATHERDERVVLSARNIPKIEVRLVDDLAAYDVLRRRKLIFTKAAFERLAAKPAGSTAGTK